MKKSSIAVIILSIFLVGATAAAVTFLLSRNAEQAKRIWAEDQIQRLKQAKRGLEQEREELIKVKQELENQLADVNTQAKALSDQLAQEKRAREALTTELAQVRKGTQRFEGQLDAERNEKEELTGELAKAKQSYQSLSNELTTLRQAKEALEKRVKEMLTARAKEAERIVVKPPLGAPALVFPSAASALPPALAGRILVVNREFNFVVVSLGSKDGILAGNRFNVVRGGTPVGTVEAERIYDNMAAANVLEEESRKAIQEGDTIELVS